MKRALLLIGMLLAFDVGATEFWDGNALLKNCSRWVDGNNANLSTTEIVEAGACLGYVMSRTDAEFQEVRGDYACVPDYVGGKELILIVVKYLRTHPERLQNSAVQLVGAAVNLAFPCKP
jgi:hypothetical protein